MQERTDLEIEEYYKRELEADLYLERHYIENQYNVVDGIVIDPIQRYYFDMTPNEERDKKEQDDWFGVPYIITNRYEGDSYPEYLQRMDTSLNIESEEDFNRRKELDFAEWCKKHKLGIYYTVRCLDGGAWDRSTWLGDFEDIHEAIKFCKETI